MMKKAIFFFVFFFLAGAAWGVLNWPSMSVSSLETKEVRAANFCCRVLARNKCGDTGFNSWDLEAARFDTVAQCNNYVLSPAALQYSCNCGVRCENGNYGQDPNQRCALPAPDDAKYICKTTAAEDFKVEIGDQSLCIVSTPTPTLTPTPTRRLTLTPTPTRRLTLTPTPTDRLTPTPTRRPRKTPTPTRPFIPTPTPTEPTVTLTPTPTFTPTPTVPQTGGLLACTNGSSTQYVAQGGVATFTVSVTNNSSASVNGIEVNDILPGGFSYRPGSTTGNTNMDPVVSGQTLTWKTFSLTPGNTWSVVFAANAPSYAGTFSNQLFANFTGGSAGPTTCGMVVIQGRILGTTTIPKTGGETGALLTLLWGLPAGVWLRKKRSEGNG